MKKKMAAPTGYLAIHPRKRKTVNQCWKILLAGNQVDYSKSRERWEFDDMVSGINKRGE